MQLESVGWTARPLGRKMKIDQYPVDIKRLRTLFMGSSYSTSDTFYVIVDHDGKIVTRRDKKNFYLRRQDAISSLTGFASSYRVKDEFNLSKKEAVKYLLKSGEIKIMKVNAEDLIEHSEIVDKFYKSD